MKNLESLTQAFLPDKQVVCRKNNPLYYYCHSERSEESPCTYTGVSIRGFFVSLRSTQNDNSYSPAVFSLLVCFLSKIVYFYAIN